MAKAACFVLILCGILSQGICQVFEVHNETSSDLVSRQKRIVGGVSRRIQSSPYLLNVVKNGNYRCPVILLTADVVIATALCFKFQNLQNLRITSRSSGNEQQTHEIERVFFLDPNFNPEHPTVKNLALVRFTQPINYSTSLNRPITIYSRDLARDHSTARIISWARPLFIPGGRRVPSVCIETISVVLFSFEYCQQVYPNIITNENMCAIGANPGEYCEALDAGAPLVKNNDLLGIFVYRCTTCATRPNVFMSLMDQGIRRWIHQHVPSLRLY